MKILPVVFVLLLYSAVSFADVLLSEIMFNPQGNERYNEFIELFNTSNTDTVDLAGWLLGDTDRLSTLLAYENHTRLAPNQFALILVENYFMNSNDYNSYIPDECLVLTTSHSQIGAYGLSNSRSETIFLFTPDSVLADSFQYSVPNNDGISEERIRYDCSSSDFWGHSLPLNGTPGYRNSIALKAIDLAIVDQSLNFTPESSQPGPNAELSITVINKGAESVGSAEIAFYWSFDKSGPFTDIKETCNINNLLPDQSITLSTVWTRVPYGIFYLSAELVCANDENSYNNCDTLQITNGYPQGSLIVNEIMYSPQPDMPEWFEIYNPSDYDVNLQNWMFFDSNNNIKILTDSSMWISPNNYIIAAENNRIEQFVDGSVNIWVPQYFPGLKNEADSVVLRDAMGTLIDKVEYSEFWGGAKGISLERLHPDVNSDQQNNWKTCVHALGHTAGRENSIFTEVLPSEATIQISPNPFSPDGDGLEDYAGITYELPDYTLNINIRIFDTAGRQVRFLCNNQTCSSTGTVFWDGRDEEGILCRMGIYIILLECIEYGKGITLKHTGTLVLAKEL